MLGMIRSHDRYFWLMPQQMQDSQPYFPKACGRAQCAGRKVPSGIIYVKRYGLRWQDVPAVYRPY
ncbi:hypothetical protein C9E81_14470 [Paracoccus alkanivorans]|uniref:Transposase n=1 Tax=Paracoccus alkanivorans TaxID=2116655 RepID=A0A3M0M9Y9_9RHOB|nr:hypothetical protein C9E81_14470 [Paracoccus alkanivorans]